jgi:hypothetical protein
MPCRIDRGEQLAESAPKFETISPTVTVGLFGPNFPFVAFSNEVGRRKEFPSRKKSPCPGLDRNITERTF